jgi:hypothetical protein
MRIELRRAAFGKDAGNWIGVRQALQQALQSMSNLLEIEAWKRVAH